MKKILMMLLMSVVVLFFTGIVYADVTVLQPGAEGKDTWIWDGEDYSHADSGEMRVNNSSSWTQYGLIEFDLSIMPTGSIISSAILGLYRYAGYSDAGLTVDAHNVLNSWTEDVTWSTQPSFDSAVQSSDTIYGNGWYTWDLTSLTQGWVDGTISNYGVALFDHGSTYYQRFVTSDNATATEPSHDLAPRDPSYRPYLNIDYSTNGPSPAPPIPEPSSMLLLGTGLLGMLGYGGRKFRRKNR